MPAAYTATPSSTCATTSACRCGYTPRLIDDATNLKSGQMSVFVRLGTDVKNNFYEYEVPLELTAPGVYNRYLASDQYIVWPRSNYLDFNLQSLIELKKSATEPNETKKAAWVLVRFSPAATPTTSATAWP